MALDMVKTEIDKRKESKESKFGLSQGKTFLKHDVRLSTCHSGPLINWKNTEPPSRNLIPIVSGTPIASGLHRKASDSGLKFQHISNY